MKWVHGLAGGFVVAVAAFALARQATRLPTLESRTQSRALSDTADTPLGSAIMPAAGSNPDQTGVYLLERGLDSFAARARLARAATRTIDAQYYIWHNDLTGGLLFNELLGAARRGVRVRLLLDDNATSGLDPVIAALSAHPNIEVRLFNPFVVRRPRLVGYLTDFSRLNRRMHNKSFTVDNQATIVGGRNIGDEYFTAQRQGALFVDLDVLAVGAVVPKVSADFDRYWTSASSYPAERILKDFEPSQHNSVIEGFSRGTTGPAAQTYLRAVRDSHVVDQLLAQQLQLIWSPVQMISDNPAKGVGLAAKDQQLFSKLREAMGKPRRTLGLVSGYFVPAEQGTKALADTAQSGVNVTVLTNALEATDVPIVHAGYAKRRKALLRAGVQIYELRGADAAAGTTRRIAGSGSGASGLGSTGSALHAKTFTVDGERAFIGSFNFDPRSRHLNTELGFVIAEPRIARYLRDRLHDLAPERAYEVSLSEGGELVWTERRGGSVIRHETEPGTSPLQRAAVALLSFLPIEWLL